MAIPRDFIDELLARTSIEEVVAGYLELKKSGMNMKGLCPFHTEKTPSFTVSPDKQIYKCFGCGKSGSVIGFIMEMESLPYVDAIAVLAKRAGMTIPESEQQAEYTTRRKRIYELNRDAAKHFFEMLRTPGGEAAREYLSRRNINKQSVTRFGLGAAPDQWSLLLDAMTKKGYTTQELIDAGLCRRNQKGNVYDFFRNRVMFPVIDTRGEVVAFSGRTLDDDAQGYKYLNSPDTIAFKKSKTLFGLNLAKKTKAPALILVEGNFDVVMLHQAGFDNAVAQLGSAFTQDHARLLVQYKDKIVIAFDADEAGRKATLKALPILEATGKDIRVVDLGGGDPDEYIKTHGTDAFRILVDESENHAEYSLQTIKKKHSIVTDAGRLAYLGEASAYLAGIESLTEREIYIVTVAKTAGVSIEAVKNEVERLLRKKQYKTKQTSEKTVIRMKENVQPAARALRYSNTASAVAEEGIIRCLVKDQTFIKAVHNLGFGVDEFTSPFLAKVYSIIEERLREDRDVTPALIMSQLEPEEATHFVNIIEKPETLSMGEKAIKEYINKIRTEKVKNAAPSGDMLIKLANLKKGEESG